MRGRVQLVFLLILCFIESSYSLKRQKRIVGGRAAAKPEEDNPVVFVNKNNRFAKIHGTQDLDKEFYAFRGIRFAEPPVGEHRFQRSRPVHLKGEFNATKWGPPCPQPNSINPKEVIGVEDCLFLNVFTPILAGPPEGHPVLIWIHGGGFRRGSACQYDMKHLIKKELIVVSVQYRLGSLGFLSTGTKDLPGNNALFDMIHAANWVKNYIEFFGGDPSKIVIFGQGSGASAALMLSVCNLSRTLFSGVIAMSGSILSHFAIDKDPLNTAKQIAERNNCPVDNELEMVRCLKEIPVENLIQTESELELMKMSTNGFISSLSSLLSAGPVIEGADDQRSLPNFMTDTPENLLKLGDFPSIPLLAGVVKDELAGALFGGYKEEVENKLKIPNFLNTYLVPSLQSAVPNFGNTTQFVSEAFGKYLNVFKGNGNSNGISNVAEIMGDSLYNVPAFLTLSYWSKKADTYLYSFDHGTKQKHGRSFLEGLPITNTTSSSDGTTCHGDDLGYIFGRNSITGEKLDEVNIEDPEKDTEETNLTEIFTSLIADFVKNKKTLNIKSPSESGTWISQALPKFSSKTSSFASITSNPRIMDGFRYCEMGLWTSLTERLQSPACNLLKSSLEMVGTGAEKTMDTIGKPINTVENKLSGLMPNGNSGSDLESTNNNDARKTNIKGQRNILFKRPSLRGRFF